MNSKKMLENWIMENIGNIHLVYDNDWFYDDEQEIISIEKNYSGVGDKHFKRILHKMGLENNYSGYVLSLMHEIGHWQTLPKMSNKKYDKCNKQLDKLYNKKLSNKKFYKKYYMVKSEYIANKWLVKFANSHKKEMKQLEAIVSTIGK